MKTLNESEIKNVVGGGMLYDIGYAIGYGAGYLLGGAAGKDLGNWLYEKIN